MSYLLISKPFVTFNPVLLSSRKVLVLVLEETRTNLQVLVTGPQVLVLKP